MDYNVTSLVQEIKTRAKDTSLSDSLIITWLQEVQDEALGHYRLSFMEAQVQPTLVQGALTYNYPNELQIILGLVLVDNDRVYKLRMVSYQQLNRRASIPAKQTPGAPVEAADYGRVLYWDRPLDRSYVMPLQFLRKPAELSSGAVVPDIPFQFKQLLVRGVLARVEEYRENFDIAALHQRKHDDIAEDMLQRYMIRQLATPHQATTDGKRVGKVSGGEVVDWWY